MTTTMGSDDTHTEHNICTVCGSLEQPGILHGPGGTRRHPFTTADQADWVPPKGKPKKSETSGPVTRSQQIVIAPSPDLALRSLLVAKGLITDEELKEAEYALRFPGGADSVPTDGGHPQ